MTENEVVETTPIHKQNPEAHLYVMAETDLEEILRELESLKPQVSIIDSIQTLHFATLNSAPGSVSQVRECTQRRIIYLFWVRET